MWSYIWQETLRTDSANLIEIEKLKAYLIILWKIVHLKLKSIITNFSFLKKFINA